MKDLQNKSGLILTIAIVIGLVIAWIDTRPHWDDTGVSVFLIVIFALICGYFTTKKPWLIALAVGLWIPIFNIILSKNYGAVLALVFAFIGTYTGYFLKKKTL